MSIVQSLRQLARKAANFWNFPNSVKVVKMAVMFEELNHILLSLTPNGRYLKKLWPSHQTLEGPSKPRRTEHFNLDTHDSVISKQVFLFGGFDLKKLERAIQLSRRDFSETVLVDIGANIGTICIPAVKRGWFKGAIALESNPHTFELLKKNVKINRLVGQIATVNKAAAAESGNSIFVIDNPGNLGGATVSAEGDYSSQTIETITLDDLVSGSADQVGMIFMDIEGYEGPALEGAVQLLQTGKVPLVMEFNPASLSRLKSFRFFEQVLSNYSYFADLNDPLRLRRSMSRFSLHWNDFLESDAGTDLVFFSK